jgi:hypothetical protein
MGKNSGLRIAGEEPIKCLISKLGCIHHYDKAWPPRVLSMSRQLSEDLVAYHFGCG